MHNVHLKHLILYGGAERARVSDIEKWLTGTADTDQADRPKIQDTAKKTLPYIHFLNFVVQHLHR